MKQSILALLLLITFTACKKSIPQPDVIKLNVFTTTTLNATTNQPEILYWYVRFVDSGGLYFTTSTQRLADFKGIKFTFSAETPSGLKTANRLEDIVVFINNLEGDIIKDFK
ncbi:hypothetical protein [Pedobacter sp. Leaf132]|uniref:hypothetical protein n=1 Tax=Pedobacter sp. Leaf132 TaxID=2876557 RepID=UPI001E449F01|nr:hypothetical protein [Pedobacter sp. Leaf132]